MANAWLRFENDAHRRARSIRRRSQEVEEKARLMAMGLWKTVEELGFSAPFHEIPHIRRRLYAHGAWMGAAPALLNDVKWRRILAFLMPDVYEDVVRALGQEVPTSALIPMFENNPVMCAYGSWRASREHDGPPECMEWDLFLSSEMIYEWEAARTKRARQVAIEKIVDTMIIGHASITDTVQQRLGLCQWADVRKTPKTQMGGVEPTSWLDLFARALILAESGDLTDAIAAMSVESRRASEEACLRFTFEDEMAPDEAVKVYKEVTKAEHLSVILEIKSEITTPWLLKAVVLELNRRSVHVEAIGAFVIDDIHGVHEQEQTVDGIEYPGPKEILFLHFAGDLQVACDRGTLQPGQAAMFNGGSLLTAKLVEGGYVYEPDEQLLSELDEYRTTHELVLGIYVQEDDLDVDAATELSKLVESRPDLFELGFAWGGLADQVALAAGKGDRRGFGAQRLLRRLGVSKTWKKRKAKPVPVPPAPESENRPADEGS